MALEGILIGPFDAPLSPGRLDELEQACRRRRLSVGRAQRVTHEAAAAEMELLPSQCALITDTPGAIHACRSVGLVALALRSPRQDDQVLRSAGARAVFEDLDHLLRELDQAIHRASPGSLHLTGPAMQALMRQALAVARAGMEAGEAPIGCVLAGGDGAIIARAHNRQNATQNKTAHAEIVCFGEAAGKLPLDASDAIMVSTLEPCVMCTGAAMEAAVDTILYALRAPADAGSQRVACPTSPESQMPRIVGGILQDESRALFEQFLATKPRCEQARFVRQLLKLAPQDDVDTAARG